MIRKIITVLIVGCMALSAYVFSFRVSSGIKVGVIVPIEHKALSEIVTGFKQGLQNQEVSIQVLNAQGDLNLQRAMIEKLVREDCDILVPIGTATSQMTLKLAPNQNIVCLAADRALLSQNKGAHATVLDDEVTVKTSLFLLHEILPSVKKITLIYSPAEKIAKRVIEANEVAKTFGITLQNLMVHNHSELYSMTQGIDEDSGAIFILKDHLIVSGIQAVVKAGEKRGIPVITSDEGSVLEGGAFALGIKEATIGQSGALIVQEILQGKSPEEIPPQTLQGPYPLFVNQGACKRQGVDVQRVIEKMKGQRVCVEMKGGE